MNGRVKLSRGKRLTGTERKVCVRDKDRICPTHNTYYEKLKVNNSFPNSDFSFLLYFHLNFIYIKHAFSFNSESYKKITIRN